MSREPAWAAEPVTEKISRRARARAAAEVQPVEDPREAAGAILSGRGGAANLRYTQSRRHEMPARLLVFITIVALAAALPVSGQGPGARHPVAQQPDVEAALTVLDAWIAAIVAQREQPGLSIGVVYDQDLIWAKGYGHADLERRVAATPATIYRIASITKLFTATAVMQLRDAGKLRLDDLVAERLPWFAIEKTSQDGPPVSIRHLLTHTSGLPRDVQGVNYAAATFPIRDDMLRTLPNQQIVFPPDVQWKYSNLAVTLAGEIVAQVSGESWAGYIERHVLQPLGMTATRTVPTADLPRLAVGYSRRVPGQPREVEPFVTVEAISPAGSLASSVEDLAKFVSLQFRSGPAQGSQILRGSTLREMHRVQWLNADWQGGWGLGFRIRHVGGHLRAGHGGSLPGHATQVEFAPDQKLGVIVLTNANDGDGLRYIDQAFELLGPAIARAVASPDAPQAVPAVWQGYVGQYVASACATCAYKFEEMQIQILNGELTMIVPDAENPWTSRMILEPVSSNTFTMTSPGFSYDEVGELLTFDVDGAGRVTRVRTPYFSWLPKR